MPACNRFGPSCFADGAACHTFRLACCSTGGCRGPAAASAGRSTSRQQPASFRGQQPAQQPWRQRIVLHRWEPSGLAGAAGAAGPGAGPGRRAAGDAAAGGAAACSGGAGSSRYACGLVGWQRQQPAAGPSPQLAASLLQAAGAAWWGQGWGGPGAKGERACSACCSPAGCAASGQGSRAGCSEGADMRTTLPAVSWPPVPHCRPAAGGACEPALLCGLRRGCLPDGAAGCRGPADGGA